MMKPPSKSIAFSTIVVIVSLFTSGCIADAECDALARGSDAAQADEGVDPCGNEDHEGDDEGDVDDLEPASENESTNSPEIAPSGLCTTPSCNKDP